MKASKASGPQFVVYVFDEGYDVYSASQALMYEQLVIIEACFIGGIRMTAPLSELTRYACQVVEGEQ